MMRIGTMITTEFQIIMTQMMEIADRLTTTKQIHLQLSMDIPTETETSSMVQMTVLFGRILKILIGRCGGSSIRLQKKTVSSTLTTDMTTLLSQ